MAEIPKYSSVVGTRPSSPAYVNSNVDARAFGAGVGRALHGLGETVGQIAAQERELAARYAAADMELRFNQEVAEGLSKFQNLKGLEPFEKQQAYQETFSEAQKSYAKMLKDPLARNVFDVKSRAQLLQISGKMEEFAASQRREHNASILKGKVELAVSNAADVEFTPERDLFNVKNQMYMAEDSIRLQLLEDGHITDDGKEDSFAQATLRDFRASLSEAMLQRYLQAAPEKGLQLLESVIPGTDYKIKQLLGPKTAEWQEKFQDSASTKFAVSYSADLIAKYGSFSDSAQKELDAKFADGALDQRTYKRALEQYEDRSQRLLKNKSVYDSSNFESAFKIYEDSRHSLAQLKASPIWEKLTGEDQHKFERIALERDATLRGLPPTRAQWAAFYNAMNDIDSNPYRFRTLTGGEVVSEYYEKLGPQLYPQLQSKLTQLLTAKEHEFSLSTSQSKIFNEVAFKALEIADNKKLQNLTILAEDEPKKHAAYTSARNEFELWLQGYRANHKGDYPTPAEVREEVSRVWRPGTVPQFFGLFRDDISEPEAIAKGQESEFTPSERAATTAPVKRPSRTINGVTKYWYEETKEWK